MRRVLSRNRSSVDEENPYWITFSDIMAGLLVIFILASIVFIMELIQKREQFDEAIIGIAKAEEVRKSILHEIETELREKNISVEVIDNDTVLRIPDHVLRFDQGSSDLPADASIRKVAQEIGNVLHQAIIFEDRWRYLDTIFVEGHTDPAHYNNPMLRGNWGLSTLRAISLWQFWNENMSEGQRLDELMNPTDKKLFSMSGYADTRRSCGLECNDENLQQSYQQDRRIDIRFTVRPPALEEYQPVREVLN